MAAQGTDRVATAALAVAAVAMSLALLASPAAGQVAPAASASAAQPAALHTELLTTGLYLVSSDGGNALLRLSGNGMVLVDTASPGRWPALMAQVKRVSRIADMPLRVLVLTHPAEPAGPPGVALVAQQNALARLPESGSPRLGYDDAYDLRLGGVEVQLRHFGPAHSDGDSVVLFPDLKVIAVGSLLAPGPPEPDFEAGGSLVGWSQALAQILTLPFDRVVPGAGPVATRADLVGFKRKVDARIGRARDLVNRGVPRDELMARLKADVPGWRLDLSGPQLDRFYRELQP